MKKQVIALLLFSFGLYSWDKEIKKAKTPKGKEKQTLNWGTSIPVFLPCILGKDSDHFSMYLTQHTCIMT